MNLIAFMKIVSEYGHITSQYYLTEGREQDEIGREALEVYNRIANIASKLDFANIK